MAKSVSKPAVLRESWRPHNVALLRARKQQLAVRLTFTGILLALASLALYLIFAPLFHPTTQVFFVTAGAGDSTDNQPVAFFQDDAYRLLTSTGNTQPQAILSRLILLENPESLTPAFEKIVSSLAGPSDVAVLHMAVRPQMINNQPYLRCGNFDPSHPLKGAVPCQELFNLLGSVETGHVLVLLDTGTAEDDQALFFDDDAFHRQLDDLTRSIAKPHFTLVVSHSPGEQSYRSTSLRCSIFSLAASLGLAGQADTNHDRQITIEEYYQFLVAATGAIVQQESGNAASQHPRLLGYAKNIESQVGQLVIGSAPPASLQSIAQKASSLTKSLTADAKKDPSAKDGSADAEDAQSEKGKFASSLTDWVSMRAEDVTDDIRNDLFVASLSLPKPLARGLNRSVAKAGNVAGDIVEGATAGKAATDQSPGNESAGSPPADGSADASVSAASNSAPVVEPVGLPDISNIGQLDLTGMLNLAWELTHWFERPDRDRLSPADLAPGAWRNWRKSLHAAEESVRANTIVNERLLRLELTSDIIGAYQLAVHIPVTVGNHMKLISQQLPSLAIDEAHITSLGMVTNFQRFAVTTITPDLEQSLLAFQDVLTTDDPELISKWTKLLEEDEKYRLIELQYARLLMRDPAIPWSINRQLLAAWYELEVALSNPFNSNVNAQLHRAHQELLGATRCALDHVGAKWQTNCGQALERARADLMAADQNVQLHQKAWQWRNQVLNELPSLLVWQQVLRQRLGNNSTSTLDQNLDKQHHSLLDQLDLLVQLLKSRETTNKSELDARFQNAKLQLNSLVESWWSEYNRLLAQPGQRTSMMASDAWSVDALLSTPLITGPQRQKLLTWKIKPASLPDFDSATVSKGSTDLSATSARESGNLSRDSALSKLARLSGHVSHELGDHAAIASFFEQLPNLISSELSNSSSQPDLQMETRLSSLREIDIMQRLILLNPLAIDIAHTCNTELWRNEFIQNCRLQRQGMSRVFEDALPEELAIWRDAQQRLSQLESSLVGKPVVFTPAFAQVIGQSPSSVALITDPEAKLQITWRNTGKDIGATWFAIDYDRETLEVIPDTTLSVYHVQDLPQRLATAMSAAEQSLVQMLAASSPSDGSSASLMLEQLRTRVANLNSSLLYPVRPTESAVEPSASMAAGQSISIPFTVRRIDRGTGQTKIIWKLISRDEIIRRELKVELADSQKIRLVAEGNETRWSADPEGINLHPWPNRTSDFRIGLVNEGTDRTVSVELLSLGQRSDVTLPDGFVEPTMSQGILNRLGNYVTLISIADVALPASSQPQWLTLSSSEPKKPAAAGGDDGYGQSAGKAGAGAAGAKPKPTPISAGLVAVITDKQSGSKLWRRIDCRVRHPRSYVQPRVRYDAVSERVIVQLKLTEGQEVPTGDVNVHGHSLTPLPSGTEMRMDALLTSAKPVELYCQVAPRAGYKLTMALDIDQYPRAFVFDVPCSQTQNDIPLTLEHQRIAILSPDSGLVFPASAQSQEVLLQVDALPGTFTSHGDHIEVGWDLDRDREFVNESTVRVGRDRSVEIELMEMKGDRLVISSRVADLQVQVPAPAMRAARMNLLAHMHAAGENTWSEAVDAVADDQPPQIKGVELLPDVVIKQGLDVSVLVGVEDRNLSGIASVKLEVDQKSNGQWDDKGTVIECKKTDEGSWTGTVPTMALPPGRINLLILATDRAGNVSQLGKSHFELVSAEEWQARQAIAGLEVSGSINYSGGELAKARVTLEDDKGKIAYQTLANAQGLFHFDKVATGKYKLVAIGVAKNRPRRVETALEVKEPPAGPIRLQLQAK